MRIGKSPASLALTRRKLLSSAGSTVATSVIAGTGILTPAEAQTPPANPPDRPFNRSTVVDLARALAKSPYQAPRTDLPDNLKNLSYDQYRDIRFRPEAAIWSNTDLPFRLQLFHRGFYYRENIDISVVEDGQARHLAYQPGLFTFGNLVPRPLPTDDIGFAGIRLHYPLNKPDVFDEVAVFAGASYFRSLGRDQLFGMSARGLALKTADREGEEFPIFRRFWVERPAGKGSTAVVHALLDSQSVSGAYRFTLRPGSPTVMDVEVTLFPRADLTKVGLAPGTSMFMFNANGRKTVDDYRPEVHDSDGLLINNGRGERLWRPLANPKQLQISAFIDTAPRGFGLMQRNRVFDAYQDNEAHYEKRPSLWVEPVGDWGEGAVTLVEIPSESEIHDNIVAYWTPKAPIKAGSEYSYAYRLSWGGDPGVPDGTAVVAASRRGRANIERDTPVRLFTVDYVVTGSAAKDAPQPDAKIWASAGQLSDVVVFRMPDPARWRVAFRLDPKDAASVELRLDLTFKDGRSAETWMYRWTGD